MSIYKCKSSSRSNSTTYSRRDGSPPQGPPQAISWCEARKERCRKGCRPLRREKFQPQGTYIAPCNSPPLHSPLHRHSQTPPSEQPIERPGVPPRKTNSVSMSRWSIVTLRNARSPMKKAKEWTKVPCHLRPSSSALLALLVWERQLYCDLLSGGSRSTISPSRRAL